MSSVGLGLLPGLSVPVRLRYTRRRGGASRGLEGRGSLFLCGRFLPFLPLLFDLLCKEDDVPGADLPKVL